MSGNCYYCGGHPDETVDLRRRRDELEAENDRLRAELARSSERIDAGPVMKWEKANLLTVDEDAFYLVQTNGGEWRDFDLQVLRGNLVAHRLSPTYVRGRPEWIAKIVRPALVSGSTEGGNG